MLLTEEFQMFVVEPLFGNSVHWNNPLIPACLVIFLFTPVALFMVKSAFFSEHS
jgi:hypothetical protein